MTKTEQVVVSQNATDNATLPITGCVITFNESENIRDCLESLSFCEALIIVDSYSSDDTVQIAESLGATVIQREWPGHIEQKNFAIEQAKTDWVFCLDADERVTPELRREITSRFETKSDAATGFSMPRRTFYLGQFIDHGGFYPDRKLRLFNRQVGNWAGTNPHDHVFLKTGEEKSLNSDIHHHSYRDISDHLKTIDYFTTIAATEKLKKYPSKTSIIINLLFGGPWKFFKMYCLQMGFRDGIAGLIVAWLGSYYVMLKYAKLFEAAYIKKLSSEQLNEAYKRKGES